uniref:Uncharacterized protein n=1 Tax=Cacopsylla melanoneura TaxID=428564 RepID=A0A8D9EDD5_9HEMI
MFSLSPHYCRAGIELLFASTSLVSFYSSRFLFFLIQSIKRKQTEQQNGGGGHFKMNGGGQGPGKKRFKIESFYCSHQARTGEVQTSWTKAFHADPKMLISRRP